MRYFILGWLGGFALLAGTSARAAETVTVGGARVTIPDGWGRADADGRVVLAPKDLPPGVVCSLTLLGGESFDGSVKDRLAADWKELADSGKLVWDDKGKLDGAGKPVEVASRAGTLEAKPGVQVHVWMVIVHANGRIERMLLVTSTPESFAKYVPAVGALIDGAKFVPVAAPAAPNAVRAGAAGAAGAAAGAFGHMRYTVPRGWSEKRYANGAILSVIDPPAGEQLELLLMTPKPATGTLPEALEAAWDDACTQLAATKSRTVNNTTYSAIEPRKSFKGWDYIRATGIVTATADKADYSLDLFVIKINDRFERLTAVSLMRDHNLRRYSLYSFSVHRQAILGCVFGMQFDDWKDARVEPASLKGTGVVGAWEGVSLMGGALKEAYAIFYSNGQVFFGSRFPLAGCDGQSTWIDAEETPRYWGTYESRDGAGVLKMSYGEIPFKSKGADLVLTTNKTDHTYVRLPAVNGATFDGTYVLPERDGKVPAITFTADGHFREDGALKVLDHEYHGDAFSIAEAPGGGTYAVRDYTITFRYADGRVYSLAYPGVKYDKTDPSPRQLTVSYNDDVLNKK